MAQDGITEVGAFTLQPAWDAQLGTVFITCPRSQNLSPTEALALASALIATAAEAEAEVTRPALPKVVSEVGQAEGYVRLRSDGRLEVADHELANAMYGCPLDNDCILADEHADECNADREDWAGPDVLYPV